MQFQPTPIDQPNAAAAQHGTIQILNQVLQGNYRARLAGESELDTTINRVIELLETQALASLDRLVALSMSASETTMVSARMMKRLQDTDRRSQGIASGVTELEASIDSINGYGQEIVSDVAATRKSVNDSAEAAAETVRTMREISGAVEQTLKKVRSLEKLSKDISDVSDTIKSIAFQTNLLSLNANVEAAKAGDAGRGFGVVAKEVGSLASRSAEATKAIEEMVKSTQAEINEIVSSMNRSAEAVSSGRTAIDSLESSIRNTEDRVGEVERCADQISHTLREQNSTVAVVGQGIREIAADTEDSVRGVSQVVSAMHKLEHVVGGGLSYMADLQLKNKVLKLAQSDHVSWKKRLINMVVGLEGLKSHELADHHGCRLGKWYDKVTDQHLKQSEAFVHLAEPHRAVHSHGKRAVDYYNRGDIDSALAEIEVVEEASEEVLAILRYLDETTG